MVERDPRQGRTSVHPLYTEAAGILELLGLGFPGLPAGIERARAAGYAWEAVTSPFVAHADGQLVAHAGVLAHRVLLAGQEVEIAGVHAVVTHPAYRRRGFARDVLDQATRFIDSRWRTAKLGTDIPDVYTPHGFRPFPLHRFVVEHRGGESRGVPMSSEGFLSLCNEREAVSEQFASLDPGWLVGIVLALQGRTVADLTWLPELGVAVDWDVRDGHLHLHDVFARTLPPLAELLALAPPHDAVSLHVCPDKLAPSARAVPIDDGVWMARGHWPVTGPVGMSRLGVH